MAPPSLRMKFSFRTIDAEVSRMYLVSHVEDLEFRWGKKKEGRFYESFFYDNEKYSLYDCVYIFGEGPKPHIGKIIEIWENPDKTKEVKLLWFLRPSDISNLISVDPDEKELFLASGVGQGLTNSNPLEIIAGKCSILCTSKDIRNLQPSDEDIKMADFIFHRTFDVGKRIIKDKIDETIAGIGVIHVFNQSRFLESCSTQKYAENLNDAETANAVVFSGSDREGCRPYKKDKKLDNAAVVGTFDKVASSVGMRKISNNNNASDAVVLPSDASDYDEKSQLKKDTDCIVTASTTPRNNQAMRELLDRAIRKIDLKNQNAEGKLQVTSSKSSLKRKQQTGGQKFEVTPYPDDVSRMYGVSHVEDLEFRWGRKKEGRFYESFFYDNEKYSLYDCVYMFGEGPEPYIGKIIEIWENPDKTKEVKLLWFFRASHISNLTSVDADEKELFLASGVGEGLTDTNDLEGISGKCSIVCTSKDSRNLQPSDEDIKMADFIFHRTFDVGKLIIKDKIDETIAGIGVIHIFNQSRFLESCSTQKYAENLNDAEAANAVVFSRTGSDREGCRPYKKDKKLDNAAAVATFDKVASSVGMLKISNNNNANDAVVLPSDASDYKEKSQLKKDTDCIVTASTTPRNNLAMRELLDRAIRKIDLKNRNAEGKLQVTSSKSSLKRKQQTRGQKFEVTPCPDDEWKKWFVEPPWEEILQDAHKDGTLVLIQNLDPSYTSEEVKDIVYHAFGEMCIAKMIQQTGFLSPYTGQALVELNTREAAGEILKKLDEELCLLLPNGRPLVASVPDPCFSREQNMFAGHINLDNIKMPPEMKAVSTAHFSQPNTIEYDMAMQWWLRQARCDYALEKLFEEQEEEFRKLQASLKSE